MRRLLQHLAGSGLIGLALLALALPSGRRETTARADEPIKAPEHKGYTETIPDTKLTIDLVPIPGGTYQMGSPANEAGRSEDEGPQHPVTVRPFWMAKCEVAWDEFDLFRKEKGVDNPEQNDKILAKNPAAITGPTPPYVDASYGHMVDGHPALCMTHHAAMQYCNWLSAKTGKLYRLPTEAEWEWAARAGTKTAYFFGDDPAKLKDYAWFFGNSDETTHKLGSKKPNPWGLHDMYGNVMEWCLDQYEKDYYGKLPLDRPALCPVLLPTDRRFSHVARGGSWSDMPAQCRSATRRGSDKTWIKFDPQKPQSIWWLTNWDTVGFRVVRAVEELDALKGIRSKVTRESRN